MELAGQDVLVMGLGVSGRSAARFCAARGARVVAADERAEAALEGLGELGPEIERRIGQPFPDPADFDLVVPSPGIPAARFADRARRAWGDVELCGRALQVPIIAVTGTNGKSTVVTLLETLARAAGLRAQAAGNLGLPALELVGQPLDLAILEVSSFQLESVDGFRPRCAVWLNLSDDHLDRHGDLAGYAEAKTRLFARQGRGDFAVLNEDDPAVRAARLPEGVTRLGFSRRRPVESGAWLDGGHVVLRRPDRSQRVSIEGSPLVGAHNQENLMAALLALFALDVDLDAAIGGLADFRGLPHRCEQVAVLGSVRFVDDSKATNPGAASRALAGLDAPILWIAGGRHKGGDLAELARQAERNVRRAFLIGEAAPLFEHALDGHVPTRRCADIDEAVREARRTAHPGDTVLLAPACASFDQFENYQARGRAFQDAVARLARDEARGAR